MRKIYGYIRSFDCKESEEKQKIAMLEMGIVDKDIYTDCNIESNNMNTQLLKLMNKLKPNDLLYIKNFEVLGNSYLEIENVWKNITLDKRADVVLLDMPQIDTRKGKTEFGTLVSNIVLTMLRYFSDVEWSGRKIKQKEGISSAKQRGVKFGRPEVLLPDNFEEVYQSWREKKFSGKRAAELCEISVSTFYHKAKKRRELEKVE